MENGGCILPAVIRIIDIQFCECVSIGTVDVGEGIG